MDIKRGTINLTDVYKELQVVPASALLGLHCITGCDTTGSFNKKAKRSWVELFFKNLNNNNLMNVLANFSEFAVEYSLPELAEFICRGYISKLPSEQEKVKLLSRCQYILALRKGSEGYQLPPTLGAFRYHLLRAMFQMSIWYHAEKALLPEIKPEDYGWEPDEHYGYAPLTTDDLIAPMVSH